MKHYRSAAVRALVGSLILSGVAAWIAAAAAFALDASPLDNFDVRVRFSWVRSTPTPVYRGESDGMPTPSTVEQWPKR